MRDAVGRGNLVADAEHFGEHGGRADLGGAHHSLGLAGMRFRLKRNTQKTLIEIHVEPLVVRPDGISGMIGGIGFGDHPVHAAKAVDQVVVGALTAHVLQERFAQTFQNRGILRIKRRLATLADVVDNPGRFRKLYTASGGCARPLKHCVVPGPVGNRKSRIDTQAVAIYLRIAGLFDQPDRKNGLSGLGGRRAAGRNRHVRRLRLACCALHKKGDEQHQQDCPPEDPTPEASARSPGRRCSKEPQAQNRISDVAGGANHNRLPHPPPS